MAVVDPYAQKMFVKNPYAASTPVEGRLVVVLDAELSGRGLQLIKPISRALRRHDIHELILTDDESAQPGAMVQQVWYTGFFEVTEGAMALVGAPVSIGGRVIGELAGFDETHMPNHLNIVIRAARPATGAEMGLQLGESVTIAGRPADSTQESEKSPCRKVGN